MGVYRIAEQDQDPAIVNQSISSWPHSAQTTYANAIYLNDNSTKWKGQTGI
jgi:hypothetical protein